MCVFHSNPIAGAPPHACVVTSGVTKALEYYRSFAFVLLCVCVYFSACPAAGALSVCHDITEHICINVHVNINSERVLDASSGALYCISTGK